MRMVGATNGFIRWPFVYEGFMIGFLGSVIAFLLQWALYEAVAKGVDANDSLQLIRRDSLQPAVAGCGCGVCRGRHCHRRRAEASRPFGSSCRCKCGERRNHGCSKPSNAEAASWRRFCWP